MLSPISSIKMRPINRNNDPLPKMTATAPSFTQPFYSKPSNPFDTPGGANYLSQFNFNSQWIQQQPSYLISPYQYSDNFINNWRQSINLMEQAVQPPQQPPSASIPPTSPDILFRGNQNNNTMYFQTPRGLTPSGQTPQAQNSSS